MIIAHLILLVLNTAGSLWCIYQQEYGLAVLGAMGVLSSSVYLLIRSQAGG
jgi:hypothetical protein